MDSTKLTLAIQKSGKLTNSSLELLKKAGLNFWIGPKSLKVFVQNFPLELILIRDDDIPELVFNGSIDGGICGQNIIFESNLNFSTNLPLDYSKCRLSLAINNNSKINKLTDLNNLQIATSYPNSTLSFCKKNNLNCSIVNLSGSVELAPSLGIADCIVDLISTGETLKSHSLEEFVTIFESQATLISNNNLTKVKQKILNELVFRLKSVNSAKNKKYVLVNVPKESITQIKNLIPGMQNPTISNLDQKGWVSMQSVIEEDKFWKVSRELKKFGGKDILLINIENIIA